MGQFRVSVVAYGGHGCDRIAKPGEPIVLCANPRCPDCLAHRFAESLIDAGVSIDEATLVHWPGTDDRVIDDLKVHRRSDGAFR